jgi:protein-disulfide isomerase
VSIEEQVSPPAPEPRETEAETLVISRSVFNTVIVAIVFLVVGVVIGLAVGGGASQPADTRALIDEAVTAAFAAQSDNLAELVAQAVAASQPPSLDDPNSRFNVSSLEEDPARGPADALVTIIEFSDFNCGYCGRWANETLNPLLEQYGDRVRFVYRDFPILADTSVQAALGAQCAQDQGAFWEYHTLLFENQGKFTRDDLIGYAAQLELDTDEFTACLDDQRHMSRIAADYQEAQALGVRGTPAFFINGRPISGAQPLSVFERIIDEELAAQTGGS